MDVTGTDPRTRAGLFLWPWAATGYSNMSTNVANGVASTTAQSVPNAPAAASLGLPHVPQMTGPGMFGAATGPGNSQPTDDAFESFYSRLSYSTGVHSSHMSSLQQQMQQREQRTCEAPNSDMQGTRVSMIQGQQSLQQQHRQQQQQQTSGSLSGLHRGEQQQQQQQHGPFADQRLMNGMMHRPSQQQAAAAIAAIASAAASRNSAAAAAVAASAPTANSASSSPLNSGAFHNPPLSPQVPPISLHQQQHSHLGHPLQQQQQQQHRPYSSTGSLHNVSTTVPSSPLDGRMSSSASPSVSSASAAGNYCLKRHPPNDFNSATAMALAVAVAAGDRHAQMQQQELGGGVVGSRSPPDQLHHALGGHIASTADVFSAATGPGQTPAQYLFPPSSPIKSFYRRPSEAAAMAAAMAAQAARDASGGMNVHAGGGGGGVGGGDRSMSMAAHQRLLGGHGGFLLSNMGAAAAAAAAVSSSAHSPLDRVPDFLSDMRLGQETPVSGSGGPLQQGGPGSNQSIGQSHSGGLGGLGSETALDTLPSLYGHAAKGYKCKICQHVCFSRQDLSTHNSTTHKQDPRPYRCDQCGRQFSTCAYLSQHRRIHSGIKPYVCRYCDRKFTQLSHVQQHERIHTGEKPYKCVTCFKSFTQMSNLQSHQRQHMKGKPHRCENCFMSYDTKEDLDLHVQAKHAGNRYAKVLVCPACSKSYNSETYLSKHMERHKEAVTNSSVGRLGLNSSGALGALSGFVNPGRGRSGSTGDLHDEIQHYPELHHLQHAAAAAAAASFMPHSESSLLHHLPPGLQGQNAAHLVAAAAAHKSEQQAGQQGHHTAGGGGLIEQPQHHVSPSSSSSGRMSVGHTPYPQQQQQQQQHHHHHQQILAAAAASHHLASSYAGSGQMPAFLNKPPSLEECMNAEELVASGLRHVARFSDSKTGFQSLAAAAVVTSPTPQPPPIAHQQTRGGHMIGDPSPRQQDNFQQYCRSPAEDQHHPQQHTDSADSLDGRSQSPGFRSPPKETGMGDKRVRKPPLETWEQHVVSGGQMTESAGINNMESSATATVTGSTSSHLGADDAVGCRSLGFYSHLSAAKRLKPDPDELEEEDNPRHLTVSDQKDCSRAGKRISLDESSAVSGSSSSSSNHQRNFGTEFLRRSAPNSASPCTADTLFHSRSHQEYNAQRQQQHHHHHPQQQQQQHQMTNLPQETMTHTVENVVDKLAKFFPLVGAGGADKRNVNTSVRDLRIEALLAGFQGQAQDARGVLPGGNDEEDEEDEADEEEEEEEIEEERRTKLSAGHLTHASRTDKGSGSQLSSSYRSESVPTTAKITAVASSPSMEDFRTNSRQPVGQSARAFMEEIRNERSHGSVQKVPGSINFAQRQPSLVGGSPSPVPPSSSPVYSTEESRYSRGLQGQANGQFFQRSGFFESSKLNDTGSGSQTYDPTNSTSSTPPTTKESDENSFCEALGHRHAPFGHSGKLGLTVHGSPLARDLSGKSAESSLEEQQQQQQQQQHDQQQQQQQQQSRSRGGINFLPFPDQ